MSKCVHFDGTSLVEPVRVAVEECVTNWQDSDRVCESGGGGSPEYLGYRAVLDGVVTGTEGTHQTLTKTILSKWLIGRMERSGWEGVHG